MVTENEDKLSTKNETENMKPALSKMTDADIQKIFDRAFKNFQRSTIDPNYESGD